MCYRVCELGLNRRNPTQISMQVYAKIWWGKKIGQKLVYRVKLIGQGHSAG